MRRAFSTLPRKVWRCSLKAGELCSTAGKRRYWPVWLAFNRYLTIWPDCEHADEVKNYLTVVEEERLKRISTVDLPPEDADVVLQLHEDSLLEMAQRHMEECVSLCQSVISKAPTFVAAYNNLAISLWQLGECDQATSVLEQAFAIPNCNAFTKALLAKYSLTAGKLDAANCLADQLIDIPLSYEDAAIPVCELLAMLGRDEDLLKFVVDNSSLQEKSGVAA